MAKITIYEDCATDLVERYGNLTEEHNTTIFLLPNPYIQIHNPLERTKKFFEIRGFKPTTLHTELPTIHPQADLYFLDGLRGRCIEIATDLPQNRTYINSTDPRINEQAQKKGYKTVTQQTITNKYLEEILRNI